MKRLFAVLAVLLLTACASPTFQMTSEQVASLGDDQLCNFHNGYRAETKAEMEIARRNLNCDPNFRRCLARGNRPGTEAMNFCIDMLRENERLRYDADYDNFDVFGYHRHSAWRH